MADNTVASIQAEYIVDTTQLASAIGAAKKSLGDFAESASYLDKQLKNAGETLGTTENAHSSLAKMGIRTGSSIMAEIAALEELEEALQDDAVAMTQVIAKKQHLHAVLDDSSQGFNKMGAANHRANLFMINFSRGMEDLKFGLPAVINNLDGIALGFEAMAKEAEAAGSSITSVMLESLTKPAGILAIMNLVITAAYLLGPVLMKAIKNGTSDAKKMREAVGDILGDLEAKPMFKADIPTDPSLVRDLAASFRGYADEVRNAAIEQGHFTEEWVSAGGQAVKVKTLTASVANEFRNVRNVSNEVAKRLSEYAIDLEATAKASEILEKKLKSLSKQFIYTDPKAGSAQALEDQISALEKAKSLATSDRGRNIAQKRIEELQRQLERITYVQENLNKVTEEYSVILEDVDIEIKPLKGSIEELGDRLKILQERFSYATSDAERGGLALQIRAIKDEMEALSRVLEASPVAGSFNAINAATKVLDDRMGEAATSTERMAIAQQMFALQQGPQMERMIMDINDALAQFHVTASLAAGDKAVDGFFDGLFGGFKKADADTARLALVDLNKGLADMEEALASGDISYEEFTIRNRMRMSEMAEAQKELALATRTNFELMADRIGNAFEGLKNSVISAFQEIAKEYTKLLVKKGILKVLGAVISPGLPSGVTPLGIDSIGSGGGNFAGRVAIQPNATLLHSRDIQISVQQAGVIKSRKGV